MQEKSRFSATYLDRLIEEATVDACNESEPAGGFLGGPDWSRHPQRSNARCCAREDAWPTQSEWQARPGSKTGVTLDVNHAQRYYVTGDDQDVQVRRHEGPVQPAACRPIREYRASGAAQAQAARPRPAHRGLACATGEPARAV